MRKLILAAALLLASPAAALPPEQALYGIIAQKSVAIYAGDSTFGLCIQIEAQLAGGAWQYINTMQCGITQATLDSHGGAVGFINWLLPDINLSLKNYFGGGGGLAAQLDEVLNVSFKFSGTALVAK